MGIAGLGWVFGELNKVNEGICPGCHQVLPPVTVRVNQLTCNDACQKRWFARIVREVGPVKRVTSTITGKTYLVPTRIILEVGIKHEDLIKFPEERKQ